MAILAMAFYALEIAITDFKLADMSPRLATLYYASGVTFFALISILINKEPIPIPSQSTAIFLLFMIVASFFAATAHFFAINQGVGTARLTLAYAFMPVAGAAYMAILKKEVPTMNLVLAWILASVALYLVSISQKPTVIQ